MAEKRIEEHDHPRYRFNKRLLEHAKSKTQRHANVSPSKSKWMGAGAGVTGFEFLYAVGEHDGRVELKVDTVNAADNNAFFDTCYRNRKRIEEAFGGPLEWDRKPRRRRCLIGKTYDAGGYGDDDNWDALCEQLSDGMVQLEKAFLPHIRSLRVVTGRLEEGRARHGRAYRRSAGLRHSQRGHLPENRAMSVRGTYDDWLAASRPHNPGDPETPGIYALYQNGVLKYMGQSRQCAFRVRKHLTRGRDWLEGKPGWDIGEPITARVQPLPGLTGGKDTEDEQRRKRVESRWLRRLRPPCNVQGVR